MGSRSVKCQIWDTTGQERYRAVVAAYYRGSCGTMIVYDITNEESFKNVQKWVNEMRVHVADSVPIMIVGNKGDLDHLRKVNTETAAQLASIFVYLILN